MQRINFFVSELQDICVVCHSVIPAKAGIQSIISLLKCNFSLDPLLQGDDRDVSKQSIRISNQ